MEILVARPRGEISNNAGVWLGYLGNMGCIVALCEDGCSGFWCRRVCRGQRVVSTSHSEFPLAVGLFPTTRVGIHAFIESINQELLSEEVGEKLHVEFDTAGTPKANLCQLATKTMDVVLPLKISTLALLCEVV